jgi:hypothetical protein
MAPGVIARAATTFARHGLRRPPPSLISIVSQSKMGDEVATMVFIAVKPSGERQRIRVSLCRPVQTPHGDWSCHVEGGDFVRGPRVGAVGVDSWQALCLALSLVRRSLDDFLQDGGRLLSADDEATDADLPIDAIFGSLRVTPGPLAGKAG